VTIFIFAIVISCAKLFRTPIGALVASVGRLRIIANEYGFC